MLFRHRPRMEAGVAIELRHIGAGIALVLVILAGSTAAQGSREAGEPVVAEPVGHGPLDGMSFIGKIGPEDNRDLDDELHFVAGQFWSSNCVACGYQPGAYWSRSVGDSIEFHGSLRSGGGGSFEFVGRVLGDQADVRIRWTQKRWYGDVERKLAFVGVLAPAAPSQGIAAVPAGSSADARPRCRRL